MYSFKCMMIHTLFCINDDCDRNGVDDDDEDDAAAAAVAAPPPPSSLVPPCVP